MCPSLETLKIWHENIQKWLSFWDYLKHCWAFQMMLHCLSTIVLPWILGHLHLPKTNMTMENSNHLKIYLPLKILHFHVNIQTFEDVSPIQNRDFAAIAMLVFWRVSASKVGFYMFFRLCGQASSPNFLAKRRVRWSSWTMDVAFFFQTNQAWSHVKKKKQKRPY